MKVSATDIACTRGGREVFAGVSFALERGGALALTGPNGSGKSSLMRIIAGLLPPSQGTVSLAGDGEGDLTLAEQAHYLGHRDAFKAALTVRENLAFWCDFLGGAHAEPGEALEAVGLGAIAHLPAAYLSAGQRRRLSLARLIGIRRPIWLLDEPTAALDRDGEALFAGLLKAHLDGGGLAVAATHAPLGLDAATLRMEDFHP